MPNTANNLPSCTCVIKVYQYYTISLSKYQKKVKEGQEQPTRSKLVNTVKIRKKNSQKRSKTVENINKTVKTVIVLETSTMVLGRERKKQTFSG